jgi:putative isomerase
MIQKHCWDEKDVFFYSVDLNLLPRKQETGFVRHSGMPRDYDCLIQRIGVSSALWPCGPTLPHLSKPKG